MVRLSAIHRDMIRAAMERNCSVAMDLNKSSNPQCIEVARRCEGEAAAYLTILDVLEGRGDCLLKASASGII